MAVCEPEPAPYLLVLDDLVDDTDNDCDDAVVAPADDDNDHGNEDDGNDLEQSYRPLTVLQHFKYELGNTAPICITTIL